jgi:hypothetical protein
MIFCIYFYGMFDNIHISAPCSFHLNVTSKAVASLYRQIEEVGLELFISPRFESKEKIFIVNMRLLKMSNASVFQCQK